MKNALWLTFLVAGCAHVPTQEPIRVRIDQIATIDSAAVRAGRPLIIEVHEGETVPLDVSVDGVVAAPAGSSIPLVAKRTFWLRIDKEGPSFSLDGVNFGQKSKWQGELRTGLSVTREQGLRAQLGITTPKP
jgi:hypothetical protein